MARATAAERIAQLRAQADKLEAQEKERERRRDTQRKIMVGAALLARAKNGAGAADAELQAILAGLGERDAKLFGVQQVQGGPDDGGAEGRHTGGHPGGDSTAAAGRGEVPFAG